MPYVLRSFGAPVFISSTAITTTVLSPHAMAPPTTPYIGTGGMAPMYQSLSSYMINGQVLDTPWIATSPMTTTWELLPSGSIFTLSFVSPSTVTQSYLVDGTTITMTFALIDGTMVTGPVLLSVNQGTLWLITCTTMASIPILHI
jgi:hypothetical protein